MVSKNQALLFYTHLLYKDDKSKRQELNTYFTEVPKIFQKNASKIGMRNVGYCLGLLHGLGKYLELYQDYLFGKEAIFKKEI
jgi:CRISPR-associated endonuclease/helicase Cas3